MRRSRRSSTRPEFVAMADDDDARNATFTKAEIPLSLSSPLSLTRSPLGASGVAGCKQEEGNISWPIRTMIFRFALGN